MKKTLVTGLLLMILSSCGNPSQNSFSTSTHSSTPIGSDNSEHRDGGFIQHVVEFSNIQDLENFYYEFFCQRNTFSFCLPDLSAISIADSEKYTAGGICESDEYAEYKDACFFLYFRFYAFASGSSLLGKERQWNIFINVDPYNGEVSNDFQKEKVEMEVISSNEKKCKYAFIYESITLFTVTFEIELIGNETSTNVFSEVADILLNNIVSFQKPVDNI